MKNSSLLAVLLGLITAYLVSSFIIFTSSPKTDNNFKAGVGGSPSSESAQSNTFETLVEDGNFVILTEALKEAGLIERLTGPENFTLFAPSDEAFSKVPREVLYIFFNNREALRSLLMYHMVLGTIAKEDFSKGQGQNVEGVKVNVNVDGEMKVNGVRVERSDLKTTNGIIHQINDVLIPPEHILSKPTQI